MEERRRIYHHPNLSPEMVHLFDVIGIEKDRISPGIINRIEMLGGITKVVQDGYRMANIANLFFEYYNGHHSKQAFSDAEQRTVRIGAFFSDIGKTGPKNATPEQQRLIIEIYGTENIHNPSMKLKDFIKEFLPENMDRKIEMLKKMDLDPEMTMRSFYDIHPKWTLEITNGDGVPPEAVAAAATHHLIRNINPDDIVDNNGKFSKHFGENSFFDKPEKLIIILDQYDAFRRRGKKNHKEAIQGVKEKIAESRFADDKDFGELINCLDTLFAEDKLAERFYN